MTNSNDSSLLKKKIILNYLKKKKNNFNYLSYIENITNKFYWANFFEKKKNISLTLFYKFIFNTSIGSFKDKRNLIFYEESLKIKNKLSVFYLNITSTQIFSGILNDSLFSKWTKSIGVFLIEFSKEIFLKTTKPTTIKKKFKKQYTYWWLYFKILSQKFINITRSKSNIVDKLKFTYVMLIKGLFIFFPKLINFMRNLEFLKYFHYIVIDFSLPYFLKKGKKIKSIKKKLKKRLVHKLLNKKIN